MLLTAQLQQDTAPASWVHYAQDEGQRFAISLGREDGETDRLQQALAARHESSAAEPAPIDVLVFAWIAKDGAVKLQAPPPDMLQSLRVPLRLVPRRASPSVAGSSNAGIHPRLRGFPRRKRLRYLY
ncbi:MAG: hypothetical protein VB142_04060 [Burkholderia sp.]